MRFSIITPSYRQLEWLRLNSSSIQDQEGVELEHIIQDAGTGSELDEWATTRPHTQLHVEKDSGMYDAVNRGLKKSTGEICSYLNCDEQYLPGTLQAVGAFFDQRPEVDILFADAVVTDDNGEYICHRKAQVPFRGQLWTRMPILTCAAFFRRRVFEQHDVWFDETKKVIGDVMWVMRAQRKGLRMAVLRRFTSIFTDTAGALGLGAHADREFLDLRSQMPSIARKVAPLSIFWHRVRSAASGIYHQNPFAYQLYTLQNPETRIEKSVPHPTQIWKTRLTVDQDAIKRASTASKA